MYVSRKLNKKVWNNVRDSHLCVFASVIINSSAAEIGDQTERKLCHWIKPWSNELLISPWLNTAIHLLTGCDPMKNSQQSIEILSVYDKYFCPRQALKNNYLLSTQGAGALSCDLNFQIISFLGADTIHARSYLWPHCETWQHEWMNEKHLAKSQFWQ